MAKLQPYRSIKGALAAAQRLANKIGKPVKVLVAGSNPAKEPKRVRRHKAQALYFEREAQAKGASTPGGKLAATIARWSREAAGAASSKKRNPIGLPFTSRRISREGEDLGPGKYRPVIWRDGRRFRPSVQMDDAHEEIAAAHDEARSWAGSASRRSKRNPAASVVSGRGWTQAWFETGDPDLKKEAKRLRAEGYRATVESMGLQVTPLGSMKMSLLDVRYPPDRDPPSISEKRCNPRRKRAASPREIHERQEERQWFADVKRLGMPIAPDLKLIFAQHNVLMKTREIEKAQRALLRARGVPFKLGAPPRAPAPASKIAKLVERVRKAEAARRKAASGVSRAHEEYLQREKSEPDDYAP